MNQSLAVSFDGETETLLQKPKLSLSSEKNQVGLAFMTEPAILLPDKKRKN
jgi:hypothetical protein